MRKVTGFVIQTPSHKHILIAILQKASQGMVKMCNRIQ